MLECFFLDVGGAVDVEVAEGGRCAAPEVCEGLVEACGAPGAAPAPHGVVAALLDEFEGAGVAECGGEAASGFGFGDGDGVAVGPVDADAGVVGVGVFFDFEGGGEGCGAVDGVLVAGVDLRGFEGLRV